MQAEIRAIAQRYDMAVMGPNSEGFANTAAALCPTFSPAMEASERPLLPRGRPRGQLAVMAQSGGIGFAFFDHGRAKELSFRYIVTTGNEACLEVLDFADFILDEGKTDALLLLLEDIKSPETFRRVAEKALRAGKPIIVNKIGQSRCRRARGGLAHGGARRRVRRLPGDVPALRADRGPRHRRDGRHRRGLPRLGLAAAGGAPRRHLHGLGRRRRLDGGCLRRRPASRCPSSTRRRAGASTSTCRPTAPRRTRSMPPRRRLPRSATPGWPSWCVPSPAIDGIIVVMTARSSAQPRAPARGAGPPRGRDARSRS